MLNKIWTSIYAQLKPHVCVSAGFCPLFFGFYEVAYYYKGFFCFVLMVFLKYKYFTILIRTYSLIPYEYICMMFCSLVLHSVLWIRDILVQIRSPRIHAPDQWIRLRIRIGILEAKKRTDPDPQYRFYCLVFGPLVSVWDPDLED
jgi:hypothetical protein